MLSTACQHLQGKQEGEFVLSTAWAEQFRLAVAMPDTEEGGENSDWLSLALHYVCITWKVGKGDTSEKSDAGEKSDTGEKSDKRWEARVWSRGSNVCVHHVGG